MIIILDNFCVWFSDHSPELNKNVEIKNKITSIIYYLKHGIITNNQDYMKSESNIIATNNYYLNILNKVIYLFTYLLKVILLEIFNQVFFSMD